MDRIRGMVFFKFFVVHFVREYPSCPFLFTETVNTCKISIINRASCSVSREKRLVCLSSIPEVYSGRFILSRRILRKNYSLVANFGNGNRSLNLFSFLVYVKRLVRKNSSNLTRKLNRSAVDSSRND